VRDAPFNNGDGVDAIASAGRVHVSPLDAAAAMKHGLRALVLLALGLAVAGGESGGLEVAVRRDVVREARSSGAAVLPLV
jgi:hypothetical protein